METSPKFTGALVTLTKERAVASTRMQSYENQKWAENFDPNVCIPRPRSKLHNPPPLINSGHNAKNLSSCRKHNLLNRLSSSCGKKKIRERKFVIPKKNSRSELSIFSSAADSVDCDNCEKAAGKSKCLSVANESLRVSHEEFFNKQSLVQNEIDFGRANGCDEIDDGGRKERSDGEDGELRLKRCRERLLEEARQSVPEPGSGRVMHLVKAFEKLLMIPKSTESDEVEGQNEKKAVKWALPGLQLPTQFPSSTSDFSLTSESLGLDLSIYLSSDGSQGSLSTRTSAGGRKSRPSSSEFSRTSSRRQCKTKQQKTISGEPLVLTTEQRGRCKEEEFMKKLQKKLREEKKLRMHVAQGLPKTTDEPEIPVKPPVKESTKPVNFMLHSDTRAMERAEFDNQVAKKMNLIEQYRVEMERQQRLEEEEEIRILRKELVPKAQPVPYFDRPFIPRRSLKPLTLPKEPKFHLPQHKKIKCYMSLPTQLE